MFGPGAAAPLSRALLPKQLGLYTQYLLQTRIPTCIHKSYTAILRLNKYKIESQEKHRKIKIYN